MVLDVLPFIESALGETVKDAMTRLSDQISKVTGDTSSDAANKEPVLAPLIQHVTAEIAAEGASILTQGETLTPYQQHNSCMLTVKFN